MKIDLQNLIEEFVTATKTDSHFELYNEAGLQHELAIYLRSQLSREEWKIKLERNIGDVLTDLNPKGFTKKEMDIFIESVDNAEKYCIELKLPNKGAYPRRIFQSFEDVKFLEQLKVVGGFTGVSHLFVTPLRGFWTGNDEEGIYKYFRVQNRFCRLTIDDLPNFLQKSYDGIEIQGNYNFEWKSYRAGHRYFIVSF